MVICNIIIKQQLTCMFSNYFIADHFSSLFTCNWINRPTEKPYVVTVWLSLFCFYLDWFSRKKFASKSFLLKTNERNLSSNLPLYFSFCMWFYQRQDILLSQIILFTSDQHSTEKNLSPLAKSRIYCNTSIFHTCTQFMPSHSDCFSYLWVNK